MWKNVTIEVGVVTLEKAIDYGILVLCTFLPDYLGIYWVATPYEMYDELNFQIPVGRHGDVMIDIN